MADGRPGASEDLGGGFRYEVAADSSAAIVPPTLGGFTRSLMSTAQIDARDQLALRRWLEAWGMKPARGLWACDQVHGSTVVTLDATRSADDFQPHADGMSTAEAGAALVVKAADCAPVWIADAMTKSLTMIHAGWRGVAAGIIENALSPGASSLTQTRVKVAVGPHLRPCCFEIGTEVAAKFAGTPAALVSPDRLVVRRRRTDSVSLDLAAAIQARLKRLGITDEQIHIASACTRCRADLFHSYRRSGRGAPLMAAVGMIA